MFKAILLLVLVLVLVAFSPLALIWALNTLFPVLSIPYTLEMWAASSVVISILTWESK